MIRANIVVFGTERSGTTVLANMLRAVGWNFVPLKECYARNCEDARIRDWNRAHAECGLDYELTEADKQQQRDIMARYDGLAPWVIKDPAMVLTLHLWWWILEPQAMLLWIHRPVEHVARSMRFHRFKQHNDDEVPTPKAAMERALHRRQMAEQQFEQWGGLKHDFSLGALRSAACMFVPKRLEPRDWPEGEKA